MSDNNDLRWKIDQAKRRLPLPELMAQVGLGDCAKKSAHCPFHDDQHKSFSMFQGNDGLWHYKCFAGCGDGHEIIVLRSLKGLPLSGAMSLYLEMAGSPPSRPPKSHEYPKRLRFPECRKSPKYHESPVYPMSNGQGLDEDLPHFTESWLAHLLRMANILSELPRCSESFSGPKRSKSTRHHSRSRAA